MLVLLFKSYWGTPLAWSWCWKNPSIDLKFFLFAWNTKLYLKLIIFWPSHDKLGSSKFLKINFLTLLVMACCSLCLRLCEIYRHPCLLHCLPGVLYWQPYMQKCNSQRPQPRVFFSSILLCGLLLTSQIEGWLQEAMQCIMLSLNTLLHIQQLRVESFFWKGVHVSILHFILFLTAFSAVRIYQYCSVVLNLPKDRSNRMTE